MYRERLSFMNSIYLLTVTRRMCSFEVLENEVYPSTSRVRRVSIAVGTLQQQQQYPVLLLLLLLLIIIIMMLT